MDALNYIQNTIFGRNDNLFFRLKKREPETNPQIMNSFVMREGEAKDYRICEKNVEIEIRDGFNNNLVVQNYAEKKRIIIYIPREWQKKITVEVTEGKIFCRQNEPFKGLRMSAIRGGRIMELRDCYIRFGGDFDEVAGRLRREQTVRKFIYKFLDDQSFRQFEAAMESKDYAEALRAVHTLKGICQNLSFTRLYESSSLVTNALKENDYQKEVEMMPRLSEDYHRIINSVEEYRSSKEE